MKVGVDSVLLGSWVTSTEKPNRILDIGSGCGLLALMMAQKFPGAKIEAIEIASEAAKQASENFESSKWSKNLELINEDVRMWSGKQTRHTYDVIICNPPYFEENNQLNEMKGRKTARQEVQLGLADLIKIGTHLLNRGGAFNMVLPYDRLDELRREMALAGLHFQRMCLVYGSSERKNPNRLLCSMGKIIAKPMSEEKVVVRNGGKYSREYTDLCSAFYLDKA